MTINVVDGYLVQAFVPLDKLVREIDLSKMDLPRDPKDVYGKDAKFKKYVEPTAEEWRAAAGDQDKFDNLFVMKLLQKSTYGGYLEKGDRVFYYADFGALSGSSGYVLIRRGWVYGYVIEARS